MQKYKVFEENGALYFYRLTVNQRVQHILILLSFTVLAGTGMPMKYYDTWWGSRLYFLIGGSTVAPIVHRISAVIMSAAFIYHVLYVLVCAWKYYLLPLKRQGKLTGKSACKAFLDLPMVPNLTDVRELGATVRYMLFITSERPSLVAHGLKEKFGYLAVFWGIPLIGISGYLLWGESLVTRYLPGSVLNIAFIAHSDEALLACIVVFIWHLYNTHLTLAPFPMGRAWLSGYLSEREMLEDHYRDYCRVMQGAGLGSRIRPNRVNAGFRTGVWGRVWEKVYIALLLCVVTGITILLCRVIFFSAFGYHAAALGRIPEKRPLSEKKFLEEVILEGTGDKKFYRGYRFSEEKQIKDHYHRVAFTVSPDRRSPCIKCHGDVPHGKNKQIRAYLNMHDFYLACQTCHVRPKQGEALFGYRWYEIESGRVFAKTPYLGDTPIDRMGIKVVPGELINGKWTRLDSDEEIAYAENFLQKLRETGLSLEEKKQSLKHIHRRRSEQSISCQQCHQGQQSLIPYADLGYSLQREKHMASRDVIAIIERYSEFKYPGFIGIK